MIGAVIITRTDTALRPPIQACVGHSLITPPAV